MEHHDMPWKRIEQFLWTICILLVPITFFPFALDPYNASKQILLSIVTLGMTVLTAASAVRSKKLTLVYSPLTILLSLFTVANILGLIGTENNILTAWVHPMGIMTLLMLLLVHLFLIRQREVITEKISSLTWAGLGVILSGITILWFSGLYKVIPFPIIKDVGFSPLGDLILHTGIIVMCLAITSGHIIVSFRKETQQQSILLMFATIVMISGIVVNVFQLATSKKPILMPYQTGWTVALKGVEIRPIFGIGLTHYDDAFVAARPANINVTPIWNVHFTSAANLFFHYVTVTGIVGGLLVLGCWFLLFRAVITKPSPLSFGIAIFLLYTMLFPPTIVVLFFLFVLSALIQTPTRELALVHSRNPTVLVAFFVIPSLVIIAILISAGSVNIAEFYGWKALDAAEKNNVIGAYKEIHTAKSLIPYRADYSVLSSRLTLAVASSLLSQENLSEANQQEAVTLIDQAIGEAKLAIELAPLNANSWQNLAEIYQNLIPTFDQADVWALATYEQAVARSPVDPLLRTNAAVILDYQGNTDQAVQALETAVSLKPNYTLARYALATGYLKQKKYDLAINQYTVLLQLLPANTEDAKRVGDDLKQVQDFVNKSNAATKEVIPTPDLNPPPTQLPEASRAGSKLPLDQEAAPPPSASPASLLDK